MPFLLVTGHPSSGKSTIVNRIVSYFQEKGKEATVIRDENSSSFSRSLFLDSQKEKDHRSFIRSLTQKYSSKNSIVICDGMNYIKGYRYELFLAGKLAKTTYGVLHCAADESTCLWLDSLKEEESRYGEDLVKALIMRYEMPLAKNRWDSLLFEVKVGKSEKALDADQIDDMTVDLDYPAPRIADIPFEEIHSWLCEGIPLTENQSTQVVPLAPTNFLHEVDRITQEVVNIVVQGQRDGLIGQPILIPPADSGSNLVAFVQSS